MSEVARLSESKEVQVLITMMDAARGTVGSPEYVKALKMWLQFNSLTAGKAGDAIEAVDQFLELLKKDVGDACLSRMFKVEEVEDFRCDPCGQSSRQRSGFYICYLDVVEVGTRKCRVSIQDREIRKMAKCRNCGQLIKGSKLYRPCGLYLLIAAPRVEGKSLLVDERLKHLGISYRLVASLTHKGTAGVGHWTARVAGQEEWWDVDDSAVSGGGRQHGSPDLLLYARCRAGGSHEERKACLIPCTECEHERCDNKVREDLVRADSCCWLPEQRGLFARGTILSGTFLASFGTLTEAVEGAKQSITWRVTGGPKQWLTWREGALGGLANSTCCAVHRNAKLVHNGEMGSEARVYIRTERTVAKGEEILVDYGSSFFDGDKCRCCKCNGVCGGLGAEGKAEGRGKGNLNS